MPEHLPDVYVTFNDRFPDIAKAQGQLAQAVRSSSPFDERTERLLKLALAIGSVSDGAVRSNARKAQQRGVNADELRAVALLAITTCGFPTCIAGLEWIDEVLSQEKRTEKQPG